MEARMLSGMESSIETEIVRMGRARALESAARCESAPGRQAEIRREGIMDAKKVRRRISPQAGRALEILGHAIEYLSDEFVHEGGVFSASDPRLEAIQLLMRVNRQIYLGCPAVPTLAERWQIFLRARTA
jgi:hypothetical protein